MIDPIVTERLELRPLVADDAEDLVGLLEDPVMREWLRSEDVSGLRARFAAWERRESPDGRKAVGLHPTDELDDGEVVWTSL